MRKANWVFLTVFLFAVSCRQPENVDFEKDFSPTNDVKEGDALLISSNFGKLLDVGKNSKVSSTNARAGDKEKVVKRIKTFEDSQQNALYHVITYDEGGFVIVSAEQRAHPILAFSEANDFPLDRELPAGVKELMDSYAETIQQLRLTNAPPNPNITAEWKRLQNTEAIKKFGERNQPGGRVLDQPGNPGCQDSQVYVTLNTAAWGQGGSWNANMPQQLLYSCSNMPNGRMLTGCVATAMAEVMYYVKHPNNFQWANMGPFSQETAFLMRSAANSVNMAYNCSGSYAFLSAVPSALKSTFGYSSSVTWSNSFNEGIVKSEILNFGRPVILGGVYGSFGGHAWVCDGYYEYISCTSSNAPLFYMNWGWDGMCNGLYIPTAADPQKLGSSLTNLAMVTYIKKS